jgi:uncharacterized iron-regulated protein
MSARPGARRWIGRCARAAAAATLAGALAACAQAPRAVPEPASVEALVQAMAREPIVLLGEVHDNVAQHDLRAQALRALLERGARPALAFEQFDRDRQAALDEARRDERGGMAARVARLIDAAGERGWYWDFYRPYLAMALEYDLPIVAANLSRAQAMRVAQEGAGAVFDAGQRAALGLDHPAAELQRAQEQEINEGHCGRLPADALAPMAAAQIARDAVLAQSLEPYRERGVVLFTGNGHARRDIGVPAHLAPADRARLVSIGLLEDDDQAAGRAVHFDVALRTPVQPRTDPCAGVPRRHGAGMAGA